MIYGYRRCKYIADYAYMIILDAVRRLGTAPFRVDWFGDIAYASRSGGHSPFLTAILSPQFFSHHETGAEESTQVPIQVPVAFLRLLRIGDIWLNGKRIGRCEGATRLVLRNLWINEDTTDTRPAGLPVEGDDGNALYLLPFSEFDAHRNHTGSFCVRVKVDDATVLIIPCMEIIRFYFGESGALLNRIFSGAFALRDLYESVWLSSQTGMAHVKLAPGLPRTAATTVARIALDNRAERAASWIIKSGIAASANHEPYYPKTTFPFEGRTDLIVDGRWLDADAHDVFFVERLLQCSHPFPFQGLFIKTSTATSGDQNAAKRKNRKPTRYPDSLSDGNQITLAEGYVTSGLVPAEINAEDEEMNPFPDLENKRIQQLRDTKPQQSFSSGAGDDALVSGASSNSLGSRSAEVSAQQNAVEMEEEPEAVRVFREAVQQLIDSYETAASLVPLLPNCETRGKSSFLRCDWLVSSPDEKLRKLWCATAAFPDKSKRPIAVLIRASCSAMALDKLVLVATSNLPAGEDALVSFCNAAFENEGFEDHQGQIVGFLEGEAATNISSVLELIKEPLRD